jgi:Leucine-rich repeat (LRR) protein
VAAPLTHPCRLKILSLARNCVSRIEGLEPVAGTLEELWLSYNQIVKLGGLECCTQLRVLYVTNNQLRDMKELECIPASVEARHTPFPRLALSLTLARSIRCYS